MINLKKRLLSFFTSGYFKLEAEAKAKQWLDYAKKAKTVEDVSIGIKFMRRYLEKAGKELGDIGTSEWKIKDLFSTAYLSEAKNLFNDAKKSASKRDVSQEIMNMRSRLTKAGKELGDIGTSEEKIKKILNAGYFAEAKNCLKKAREEMEKWDNTNNIAFMDMYLEKVGKKLKDIGTDKDERKKLLSSNPHP